MMVRMNLFLRNGIYYLRFYRGKEKSLRTRDEATAKALFREIKREWLRGKLLQLDEGKRITLAEFNKTYLQYRESEVALKTWKADRLALRLLADVVGANTALRTINLKKIDRFRQACRSRGCTEITIRTYLRHIKAALGIAEDWYEGYKRPKIKIGADKLQPRPIPLPELRKLLRRANARLKPIIELALHTGLRRSELLNLQWQDVHLGKNPYLKVTGKGNKKGIVPLLPKPASILKRMRKEIGPVFVQVHPDTITHWFRNLCQECGIKARFHDLRHSAATYLLASGTRIEVVSKVLRHSDISTTQIYAEILPEVLYKEMKLDL